MTITHIIYPIIRFRDSYIRMFGVWEGVKVISVAIVIGLLSLTIGSEGMDSFIYFILMFGLYAFIFGVYKHRNE